MSKESATSAHFDSLRSILGGASVFVTGQAFRKLAGFAINALLLRGLSPKLYGIYAYAKSFIDVSNQVATLGSDLAVLRFLPAFETDPERQNRVLGAASATSLVGTFLIAGGLFVLAPVINEYTLQHPLFVDALRVFALVLPFDALSKLVSGTFRGIELATYQVFVAQILRPVLRLAAVVFALLIGFSLLGTIGVLVVASVAIFVRIEGIEPALVVEMIDNVGDVAFEAILFDPLRDVLRQEVLLILIVSDEVDVTGGSLRYTGVSARQNIRHVNSAPVKSDFPVGVSWTDSSAGKISLAIKPQK